MGQRQRASEVEAWFLIREHTNGWVGRIEASDVSGKWHVAAYPTDGQAPPAINGYVTGRNGAMQLADTFVTDHAPHECKLCGPWRRADDQRLSVGD